MPDKRVINKLTITELSAVDKPAQEGAVVTILKREGSTLLLTVKDDTGHSHFIDADVKASLTSYSMDEGGHGHDHPFVINVDGTVTIGEADGHSHSIDENDLNQMLMTLAMKEAIVHDMSLEQNEGFERSARKKPKYLTRKFDSDCCMEDGSWPIHTEQDIKKAIDSYEIVEKNVEVAQHIKNRADALGLKLNVSKNSISFVNAVNPNGGNILEIDMPNSKDTATDAELQKSLDDTTAELETIKAELEISKALNEMDASHKTYYDSLTKAKKKAFLEKSAEDRNVEIEKATSQDPVVYTSESGEVFHKSDDPRIVRMAKRADESDKRYKEEFEKRRDGELQKRAESELQFMPGSVETRVALLKSVDAIEDEETRNEVLKSLKATNAAMSKAFTTIGTTEGDASSLPETADGANAELDKLAKKRQEEKQVNYFDAYDQVSNENPELHKRAVQG